jgi:hypothetical protein|tara:strand:- start:432 stop:824 length:393 start_codon:yes stop_codon:yes gene_type:complete
MGMDTLIINNKFLYIRKIKDYDVKYSYYNVMSVLPREYIKILTSLTIQEIEVKLKECKIFIIEDVNSKVIVGSGILSLLNYSSIVAIVGLIEEITIKKEYESAELRNEVINHLTEYCISEEKCIKCILKE